MRAFLSVARLPAVISHLGADALHPKASCIGSRLLSAAAAIVLLAMVPRPGLGQVDPTFSFFVPQTGSVATPTEGAAAIPFFRQCPNNDASALAANARIKVVVKDGTGLPIPSIPAADICVLFNGGTPAQGFGGFGADSVVANGTWNTDPACPDLRCIMADAPTDPNGVTYITFKGSTPGMPGVATRDPNRKWGHYDSELPVFVLGTQLQGRLTTGSSNGTYVLRIKNVDVVDGLEATMDAGEYVSFRDLNVFGQEIGQGPTSLTYWLDLNSDGSLTVTDFNIAVSHANHDCTHPSNP